MFRGRKGRGTAGNHRRYQLFSELFKTGAEGSLSYRTEGEILGPHLVKGG